MESRTPEIPLLYLFFSDALFDLETLITINLSGEFLCPGPLPANDCREDGISQYRNEFHSTLTTLR